MVSTIKTLLYAGNSWINSPLVLIALGTIYLFQYNLAGQSAENFIFSTNTTVGARNTYNKYTNLPTISDHVPKHKSDFTDNEFGHFLAGLIEGGGWFGKRELHVIFSKVNTSLAYLITVRSV